MSTKKTSSCLIDDKLSVLAVEKAAKINTKDGFFPCDRLNLIYYLYSIFDPMQADFSEFTYNEDTRITVRFNKQKRDEIKTYLLDKGLSKVGFSLITNYLLYWFIYMFEYEKHKKKTIER